jgi:hypothetical protein
MDLSLCRFSERLSIMFATSAQAIADRGHHEQEHDLNSAAVKALLKGEHTGSESLVSGELACEAAGNSVEFRAGLLQGHARFENRVASQRAVVALGKISRGNQRRRRWPPRTSDQQG